MTIGIFIYVASTILTITVGIIISFHLRGLTRSYFILLCSILALWLEAQLLSIIFPDYVDLYTTFGMIIFSFAIFAFAMIAINISNTRNKKYYIFALSIILIATTTTSLLPQTITSVSSKDWGIVFEGGWLYSLQTVLDVATTLIALHLIWASSRYELAAKKVVLQYFMCGIVIFLFSNILAGLIFANNENMQLLVPISVVALVFATGIGVIENSIIERRAHKIKIEVIRATKELKHKNNLLFQNNKEKDDFISITSHQIRTPLTVINSYNSLMLNQKLGSLNKNQREALLNTQKALTQIKNSIERLLDAAKLDSGSFQIKKTKINLIPLVYEIVQVYVKQGQVKGIDVMISTNKNSAMVVADGERIQEVIGNFLDNALQYTRKNGSVKINVNVAHKFVDIRISDTGIGIASEDQEKLFEKFVRINEASLLRPEGTGLGLFFAKQIIEMHGGKIIFKSELNIGSTFGFTLPVITSVK